MPAILRWFTWMCFGFALFLPLSLIPYGSHRINEVEVTFAEFWRRGGGPLFFIAGIVFPILGYGFVRRRNWARYGFTAVQVALAVVTPILGGAGWEGTCRGLCHLR